MKKDTIPKEILEKIKSVPKFPRLYAPWRVHWNWETSFKCNYHCSYCEVVQREKEFTYKTHDIGYWAEVWERIFEKYWSTHVRFSGGEPSVFPQFIELISMLLKRHTVDITTNLSFDIDAFMEKVPPNRGLSISASYHPEFNEMKAFLAKVKRLHFNGFPSTICYVGYPPNLGKIAEYKKMVEAEHIYFKIIPFAGKLGGTEYPGGYTEQEKRMLEGFAQDSKDEHLNDMNTRWYEWRVKKEEEPAQKIKKGSVCLMGYLYAKIHPDGVVTRCCAGFHGEDSGVLGAIGDPDFKLDNEPQPCKVSYQCPCFKGMVVGQEESKWLPLWEALEHPVYRTEYIKEYIEYLSGKR